LISFVSQVEKIPFLRVASAWVSQKKLIANSANIALLVHEKSTELASFVFLG
jgi:hypothetical protein